MGEIQAIPGKSTCVTMPRDSYSASGVELNTPQINNEAIHKYISTEQKLKCKTNVVTFTVAKSKFSRKRIVNMNMYMGSITSAGLGTDNHYQRTMQWAL